MKRLLKIIIIILWCILVVIGLFGFWLSDQYVVPIMMYHSVNYEKNHEVNTIHPVNFAHHMEFLTRNHYNIIGLDELVEAIDHNKPLARKSVVITFDDGYRDNYTYAFKILKQYGFPATIFVVIDEIGKEGYLTWKQIREMKKNGITIGSHTRTHAYLPDISKEDQVEQIEGSKRILEKRLGRRVNFFAYPAGGFSEQIKGMVRESGYRAACTTNRGYSRLNKDLYELKRFRFGDEDNLDMILFVKLSGFYSTFKQSKAPY